MHFLTATDRSFLTLKEQEDYAQLIAHYAHKKKAIKQLSRDTLKADLEAEKEAFKKAQKEFRALVKKAKRATYYAKKGL